MGAGRPEAMVEMPRSAVWQVGLVGAVLFGAALVPFRPLIRDRVVVAVASVLGWAVVAASVRGSQRRPAAP